MKKYFIIYRLYVIIYKKLCWGIVVFTRTEKLIGKENMEKIKNARVIVFGVGGVGGYAVEALVRAGICKITVVDNDFVSESNINRQIIALNSTVGKLKTDVIKERILDINPLAEVTGLSVFFDESTEIDFKEYDFIVDCIDSVNSKIRLIKCAKENNVKIISAMGTGNKICPEMLEIKDIKDTSYCPLARKVRSLLKKEGIYSLPCVYSKEEAKKCEGVPASISFVPSAAGLLMASYVIRELIK